jgi:hypothetical protein
MLSLLLVTAALAGWTETNVSNDCHFFKGDAEGAIVPLRAECDWPIAPTKLMGLLDKIDDHDLYFSSVADSRVVATNGGEHNVYQVHQATGIADREAMLIYTDGDIPGGHRYAWRVNPDQTGITGEKVRLAMDTGKWEITAGQGGGAHVVYELRYDAGGSVPGFVVRWFQGSGVRALVGELRTWAESH